MSGYNPCGGQAGQPTSGHAASISATFLEALGEAPSMARQGKPQSELAPVTLSQLGYAFMAYRRSVGDYHGASLGADSARAAGVIEVTYEALVQLAAKAGLPNMPPKPQARNSWHGDWSDWGLWLDSLKDWWAEAEARLSAGEERAGGLGARKIVECSRRK